MDEEVIVVGRVVVTGKRVTLVPSKPTGITTPAGRSVTLVGQLDAPTGSHVSVAGRLDGSTLTVRQWRPDAGPDELARRQRDAPGVSFEVARTVLDEIVDDGNVISVGLTRTRGGSCLAQAHVARATGRTAAWVAARPAGSLQINAFVRDIGLPAVLVS